ncbi:MAG: sulfotransferase family 2 domain-containing protein [Leptospirillia bacterium]
MIVSHKHRFIFIHIYKVAGTSLRRALAQASASWWELMRSRLTGNRSTDEPHLRARQIRERLTPEVYDTFYKFAFVRNPWDWQVSLYHYALDNPTHFQHELMKQLGSFEGYLRWRVEEEMRTQKDFVTDETGRLIVDYIGRLETLSDDFSHVLRTLGLKQVRLPQINRSSHKPYQDYYTDTGRELVAQAFGEDIEMFGYDFDGIRPNAGPVVPR